MPRIQITVVLLLGAFQANALYAAEPVRPVPAPREKASSPVTDKDVRAAVARSLPFVEKGGVAWIEKRGCMSCHTFAFTIWAHQEAKLKGFDVPQEKMEKWLAFARKEAPGKHNGYTFDEAAMKTLRECDLPENVLARLKTLQGRFFTTEAGLLDELAKLLGEDWKKHKGAILKAATREERIDSGDPDTYSPLIIASTIERTAGFDKEWITLLARSLAVSQKPEGFWTAGGQLPGLRRSGEEGNGATTMWSVLALLTQIEDEKSLAQTRDKAKTWLKKQKTGTDKSTEHLILRILLHNKLGERSGAKDLLQVLLGEQKSDGGWSWGRGEKQHSDAFATGQALYVLSIMGLTSNNPAVQRGRQYLLRTQQEDGSWLVVPDEINNAASEERLKRTGVIWTYWGSAWATIGLLRTLEAR